MYKYIAEEGDLAITKIRQHLKKLVSGKATAQQITGGTLSNLNQIWHGLNPMKYGKKRKHGYQAVQATKYSHPPVP